MERPSASVVTSFAGTRRSSQTRQDWCMTQDLSELPKHRIAGVVSLALGLASRHTTTETVP